MAEMMVGSTVRRLSRILRSVSEAEGNRNYVKIWKGVIINIIYHI